MEQINIGLLQAHNTLNNGNMLLCVNTVFYLNKHIQNSKFIIPVFDKKIADSRLSLSLPYLNFQTKSYPNPYLPKILNRRTLFYIFAYHMISRHSKLIDIFNSCEIIVVLGGDEISEYYSITAFLHILMQLNSLKKVGKRIYLLSQTIGPLHSWRVALAQKVLRRMDGICHRGPASYAYMKERIGIAKNNILSSDLGFLDTFRKNIHSDCYDNIFQKPYLCFVPTIHWQNYARNIMEYIEGIKMLVRQLIKVCRQHDLSFIIMPHSYKLPNDIEIIKRIQYHFNDNRIHFIDKTLLPYQAREILGSSCFVVTQKMHAAISSFHMGVPALCLSCSEKFSDVIGRDLGLPSLVVEINRNRFLHDIKCCLSRIDSTFCRIEEFRQHIPGAVSKAKRNAQLQIQWLANRIHADMNESKAKPEKMESDSASNASSLHSRHF